jgi:hypothetical protein
MDMSYYTVLTVLSFQGRRHPCYEGSHTQIPLQELVQHRVLMPSWLVYELSISQRVRPGCAYRWWQWNVRLPFLFSTSNLITFGRVSTPLYQVVTHALSDESNRTKFTLLFSNVTEKDILLREEFDALKKQHPNTFNVVYLVDKAEKSWSGVFLLCSSRASGRFTSTFRTNRLHLSGRDQGTRSPSLFRRESQNLCLWYVPSLSFPLKPSLTVILPGPPGQVASVAGKKAGMKQGDLGGILKELGYTEDQVGTS